MTARHEPPPNPIATAAWVAGTLVTLVTILLWTHPELWLWVVAVWAVSGLLGLGIVAAEARAEVRRLKREMKRRDREAVVPPGGRPIAAVDGLNQAVNAALDGALGEAIEDGRRLRAVPTQREGTHDRLPVADVAVPIHTAVDDDDIEALMRATEEK